MLGAPVYHDPDHILDWIQFTPHAPFWALLGILCGLVVLPRFWATRIFTLNLHASAITVIYAIAFINALVWRDHARYIPIYTETSEEMLPHLVSCSRLLVAWLYQFVMAMSRVNYVCVVKFLWICSTPSGMIRVSDQVRLMHYL